MAFKLPKIEAAIQMVDNVTAPMRRINNAIDSANAPVKRLSNSLGALSREAKLSALGSALGNLKGKLSGVGAGFSKSMGRLSTATALGAGALTGLFVAVEKSASAGDRIAKFSRRVGLTVEGLQALRFAAERSGVGTGDADKAFEKFGRSVSEAAAGTGEAGKLFSALGIPLKDSAGRLRKQEDVLLDLAQAYTKIQNPQDKLRASLVLFGKSGGGMVEMLNQGKDGVQGLMTEYQRLGGGLSQQQAINAEIFEDRLSNLKVTLGSLTNQLASNFIPVISDMMVRFQEWALTNTDTIQKFAEGFAQKLPQILDRVGSALMSLAQSAGPVIESLLKIMNVLGPGKVIFGALAAFIAGPFVLSLLSVIPALFSVGSAFTATLAALGGVSGIMAAVGGAFSALSGVITATVLPAIYSIGTALLTTPVGWILAAIAAIAGAVYLIWKNWDTVSGWIMSAWGKVSAFLDTSIGKILAVFVFPLIGIPLLIIKHWGAIWGWFRGLWGRITAFFQTTVGQVLLTFVAPFIGIPLLIYRNWGAIVQWFSDLWTQVSEFFNTGVGQAVAMLVPFIGIPLMIYKHWGGIKDFFSGLWDGIQVGFSAFIDGFLGAWDWLNGAVDLAVKKLVDMVSGVPIIGDVLSKAVSFFGTDARPTGADAAQAPAQNYRTVNEHRTSVTRQESTVAVNFQNLPAGARVAQPQGEAPIKVSAGFAFAGGF